MFGAGRLHSGLFHPRFYGPPSDGLMQNAPAEKTENGEISQRDVKFMILRDILEVKRDELKPQWLRDFQDSQRRGQSAPS